MGYLFVRKYYPGYLILELELSIIQRRTVKKLLGFPTLGFGDRFVYVNRELLSHVVVYWTAKHTVHRSQVSGW